MPRPWSNKTFKYCNTFLTIQEFQRVLFDAIEQSFEINDIYGVISDLYEGVGTDFVKCEECGYQSQIQSKFYDLQLTVRNEFENVLLIGDHLLAIQRFSREGVIQLPQT